MKIKKINTYILNRRKIPFFVLYLEKTNFEIYTYVKKKKRNRSIVLQEKHFETELRQLSTWRIFAKLFIHHLSNSHLIQISRLTTEWKLPAKLFQFSTWQCGFNFALYFKFWYSSPLQLRITVLRNLFD